MQRIIDHIRSVCDLPEESASRLVAAVTPCRFNRRQMLVEAGRKTGYAYFIVSGMTRSYWLVEGEEITTSFSFEGAIVFSMDEVYYDLPSEEFVEAVEPIEAFAIEVAELRRLWAEDFPLCRWGLRIHQNEYRRIHQSHRERLTLPAAARYEAFCRQFPEAVRRARLGDIASYLGVDRSTLSRLRRR